MCPELAKETAHFSLILTTETKMMPLTDLGGKHFVPNQLGREKSLYIWLRGRSFSALTTKRLSLVVS